MLGKNKFSFIMRKKYQFIKKRSLMVISW